MPAARWRCACSIICWATWPGKKQIVLEKDLVRLATHKVTLAVDQEDLISRLAALYRQGQLSPPTLKEAPRRP